MRLPLFLPTMWYLLVLYLQLSIPDSARG
ncbi:hypothetical protein BDFB_010298 [Asbolus verrucosus]|uniref:Uncharacterized protein n=1 Tax=Asbolus verrucosus TaxID=1661398 RepID=A0A482VZT3_ASBVE|nr:hypothetical protein BDFB_010298 [Asbolus verrucosus]